MRDCYWKSQSDEQKAELKATAEALSSPGKGFLASDESAGPWLRAGHVEAKKIADTPEMRAAYRSMLYTTPGLSQYVSGVILHQETLFQKDAKGRDMVALITGNGMVPGIKLDKGYDKSGIPGTAVGPLGHPETWCKGIDDLEKRCAEAYAQGARFAKWRNVLQIDPASGLPSDLSIEMATGQLAEVCIMYPVPCQRQRRAPVARAARKRTHCIACGRRCGRNRCPRRAACMLCNAVSSMDFRRPYQSSSARLSDYGSSSLTQGRACVRVCVSPPVVHSTRPSASATSSARLLSRRLSPTARTRSRCVLPTF